MQSSGKSSVLESIVGKDFLPRGSGQCYSKHRQIWSLKNWSSQCSDQIEGLKTQAFTYLFLIRDSCMFSKRPSTTIRHMNDHRQTDMVCRCVFIPDLVGWEGKKKRSTESSYTEHAAILYRTRSNLHITFRLPQQPTTPFRKP